MVPSNPKQIGSVPRPGTVPAAKRSDLRYVTRAYGKLLLLLFCSLLFSSYCGPSNGDHIILLVSIPMWPTSLAKIQVRGFINGIASGNNRFEVVNGQPGFAYELPAGAVGRVTLDIQELDDSLCPIDSGQLETVIEPNSNNPVRLTLSLSPITGRRPFPEAQALQSRTSKDLQGIWGSDGNNVYAVGAAGTVVRCGCGSTVCNQLESNLVATPDLHSVRGADASHVYAVGDRGALIRCAAGAALCAPLNNPSTGPFNTVWVTSRWGTETQDVWLAGDGGGYVHCSTNSASVCQRVTSNTTEKLRSIWGSRDSGYMYLVGGNGGTGALSALGCSNGGYQCAAIDTVPQRTALNSVWGANQKNVYIAGENGTILRGHDRTFVPLTTGIYTEALLSIGGVDADNVYVVGVGGTIVRCTSATTYCTRLTTNTSATLRAVWASDAANVYVAGDGGTVLHCSGTETTCSMLPSGTLQDLYAIWGNSEKSFYVAGRAGTIIRFQP